MAIGVGIVIGSQSKPWAICVAEGVLRRVHGVPGMGLVGGRSTVAAHLQAILQYSVELLAVYFNFGDKYNREAAQAQLGKAFLVGRLQAFLQTARLHLPKDEQSRLLAEELANYEVELLADASSREGAFQVGTRDELVTALGLAILEDPLDVAFNRETGAVAIRAASAGTAGAYRLRYQMKGTGRQITGKRFFEHFGIDVSTSRTFEAIDFEDELIGFRFEVRAAVDASRS